MATRGKRNEKERRVKEEEETVFRGAGRSTIP
jgi:hypothetical protein